MKKRLWALLLVRPLLEGCAAEPQPPLMEKVLASLTDAEGLVPFPPEEMEMAMDLIAAEGEEAVWLVSGDGISAREAVAFRAKSKEKAEEAAEKMEAYRQRRLRETRDYLPKEYALLDAARVEKSGCAAVLIVGEHAPQETEKLLRGE